MSDLIALTPPASDDAAMTALETSANEAARADVPAPRSPRPPFAARLAAAWLALRGIDSPQVIALTAAAQQEEKAHTTLDALGVPRERHGQVFTLEERLALFVDRLSERLHTQVENNMLYFNLCREVIVLLKDAPNSANFRTRTAIAKLEAVTIAPAQAQRVQSLGGIES